MLKLIYNIRKYKYIFCRSILTRSTHSSVTENKCLCLSENKLDWKLVITEEKSGEWITDGSIPFKLKCVAVNLNQSPVFKWHGEVCEEKEGDVCSFTPSLPEDDGKLVTCSAYNVSHGLLASTSYTVKLKCEQKSL